MIWFGCIPLMIQYIHSFRILIMQSVPDVFVYEEAHPDQRQRFVHWVLFFSIFCWWIIKLTLKLTAIKKDDWSLISLSLQRHRRSSVGRRVMSAGQSVRSEGFVKSRMIKLELENKQLDIANVKLKRNSFVVLFFFVNLQISWISVNALFPGGSSCRTIRIRTDSQVLLWFLSRIVIE